MLIVAAHRQNAKRNDARPVQVARVQPLALLGTRIPASARSTARTEAVLQPLANGVRAALFAIAIAALVRAGSVTMTTTANPRRALVQCAAFDHDHLKVVVDSRQNQALRQERSYQYCSIKRLHWRVNVLL